MSSPKYYITAGRIIVRDVDDLPIAVVTARPFTNTESNELTRLIVDLLNAHAEGLIVLPVEGR